MNIVMVSSYDCFYPGGVGEHIRSLSAALRQRGHTVTVLGPSNVGDARTFPGHVRTGRSHQVPGNGSRAHVGVTPRLRRPAKDLMRTSHFDIAHYHEPLLPTLPMLVMRLHGGANVGTFHASGDRSPAYRCARPVLMPFFRRLHMCVAVSEPARDFADRYFPGDYRIVPNGVDTTRFRPDVVRDAQLRSQVASTLLYVGRLDRRKGVLNLLEAFARLRQMRDDVRLVVIGDGPMRSRCERFVAHNHVPGVTFAGFVEAERLPGCYAAGDVFCAPSTGQESFGIVLLEAMASGIPVVASSIPGYSRIVRHERDGFLVPPRDVSAWTRALRLLVDDPVRRHRMGSLGVADAARYDWNSVASEMLEIYTEAISRRRRGLVAADATMRGAVARTYPA